MKEIIKTAIEALLLFWSIGTVLFVAYIILRLRAVKIRELNKRKI